MDDKPSRPLLSPNRTPPAMVRKIRRFVGTSTGGRPRLPSGWGRGLYLEHGAGALPSHEGAVRNEAAFRAGVGPIPAPSDNTVRHRLNRWDWSLSNALRMVAVIRMTHYNGKLGDMEKRRPR